MPSYIRLRGRELDVIPFHKGRPRFELVFCESEVFIKLLNITIVRIPYQHTSLLGSLWHNSSVAVYLARHVVSVMF